MGMGRTLDQLTKQATRSIIFKRQTKLFGSHMEVGSKSRGKKQI
jgi:hypothetical protein